MICRPTLDDEIARLVKGTKSPSEIAYLRKTVLFEQNFNDGSQVRSLPFLVVDLLTACLDSFFAVLDAKSDHDCLAALPETKRLCQLLEVHANCCEWDVVLAEELGLQGSHVQLLRILKDTDREGQNTTEAFQDTIMELRDLTCSIAASYGGTFPMCAAPLSLLELKQRLPLVFEFETTSSDCLEARKESIWIQQITRRQGDQDDVGFLMWPSSVVLACWLANNSQIVNHETSVLEIGSGCGLVGILASRHVQGSYEKHNLTPRKPSVILSDFNPSVLDNLKRNIALNNVADVCTCHGLDFYQQEGPSHSGVAAEEGWLDMRRIRQAPVDVVLGADVICRPSDAVAASRTIYDALREGGMAYIVCATVSHRFGVDVFPDECRRVGLTILTEEKVSNLEHGAFLKGEMLELTTGYVEGMELAIFVIEKPLKNTG